MFNTEKKHVRAISFIGISIYNNIIVKLIIAWKIIFVSVSDLHSRADYSNPIYPIVSWNQCAVYRAYMPAKYYTFFKYFGVFLVKKIRYESFLDTLFFTDRIETHSAGNIFIHTRTHG